MIAARENGTTLVELLVGAAIAVAVLGAVLATIQRIGREGRVLTDTADLSQALRVAADLLQMDLRRAGMATDVPLGVVWPAIIPARLGTDGMTTASADRLTLLYQPAGASSARLSAPVLSADLRFPIVLAGACGVDPACGFSPGMRVALLDESAPGAGLDLVTVAATGPGWMDREPVPALMSRDYRPETTIVMPIVERAYYLDRTVPGDLRLVKSDDEGAGQPILNGVRTLQFTYYGEPRAARLSRRGAADGSCLFDPGPPIQPRLIDLLGPSPVELSLAQLQDGPACGPPSNVFDADLLRIRRVRVRLEVAASRWGVEPQASVDFLLDVTPRLFAGAR